MISLTPLIERLADKPAGFEKQWFRAVDGGAAYALINLEALPLPAAWVIHSNDKSRHVGERAEDTTNIFDVVICIENARRHKINEIDDELLGYRLAVKNLLLGWEIEPDVRPIVFNGGRVLQYREKQVFWAESYSFDAVITNYLPDPPPFESAVNTGDKL